ncbi:gliding motility-associated C-terminal domain-containing protein [Mucilaginibacter sp. HMF5004]|uniref:gliding motility-associated C-terminal domain-containing protein n=1 Tax=Mucilaginibacter rivuli TaxID=2857527 RepID=UPI001C5E4DDD|nr:gliding motility-associated C-terminal domain-containing protein [Mucilaginibacter rivuli]MBW4890627.1 gliding motility-associated C-terminal domain-containing protein [Mucilaginibacter rivuli]
MKKKLLYLLYALFFTLSSSLSYGQAFTATYAFGSVTSSTGLTDPTPVPTATGVTFGSFSAVLVQQVYTPSVAPPTNPGAGGRFSFSTWPPGATTLVNTFTGGIDLNQYYQVTITPNSGTSVTLSTMTFDFQRSSTGVRQYAVRSSLDSYGANLTASINPANIELSVVPTNIFQSTDNLTVAQVGSTVTFDATAFANVTGPITLRFYGFNAEGSGGTFSLDNVVINGTSQAAAATPTLTATTTPLTTPTSIDFGTTQTVSTTSAAKTFSLSGTNIPAGGVTLSVAAPYSISTDNGSTYGLTGSYTQAQMASAQTVSVKFNAPATPGATTGTVAIASGTATATVALTGTAAAAAVATLTATPTSLAFGNVNQGVPSVKTYTLSGANLGSTNAVVTATGAYTLSKSNAGPFTATLTFTPAELTAATAPTVYVQFSPVATGAANSSITTADADVTTLPTVTVTGTGVVPVLTATTTPATTPTSIDFGNQTTATNATKSYVLTGANIIAGSTTTVSSNNAIFTVSKTNGSGYASSITFTATEIAAGPTVYVQFAAGTLGLTGATITNSTTGTGATNATVTVTGTSVAAPVPLFTLNPTSLTFSSLINSSPASQSYIITGANISGASTITATGPYSLSKTSGGTYTTSLTYTTADFPSGSGTQTVWVKFSPTVVAVGGVNNGTVGNATTGGTTQTLNLNGTGIGIPALTVAPTSLAFSQIIGGTSTAQTYTLTGAFITATSTTVTVAAPYSISKTGTAGTYSTSLSYTTAEMATPQTVFVVFSPTVVAVGGVNNGSALNVSTGATNQSVTLTGTGLAVPTLTATTTPATTPTTVAFGNQSITATSAGLPFTLTGANITTGSSTTVTVAAPFAVSKTSVGGYGTSITYTATEMASPQTVYVNFAPGTKVLFNGAATIASPGATNATVTLSGTGIDPPNVAPTLAAIADPAAACYTATPQTIALSGISPVESSQIAVVSVSSSNPALFASIGILPISATTATLTYTFAPGISGSAVVSVTVKDNGGTLNGGVDTFTQTFNVTLNGLATVDITSSAGTDPIELGQTVTLTATGGVSYLWDVTNAATSSDFINGNTGASVVVKPGKTIFNPQGSGGTYAGNAVYKVTAYNAAGCPTTKTITINTYTARKLVTNNVITPNGDGINDTWNIVNIEFYKTNNVKVFDKAGKIVFSQSGYLNTWDGSYNGAPLTQGTYQYVVDLGNGTKYTGYISIVRD